MRDAGWSAARRLSALATLLCALLLAAPAAAQPSGLGLNERQLIDHGLPAIEIGGLRIYHSAPSREAALRLGAAVADAYAWLQAASGLPSGLVVAVLDKADWGELVTLPWPVPHAEITRTLAVMPASIEDFPGFDRWGLDGEALNIALTVHEIGHIVTDQAGISRDNIWIDELAANLAMAAYLRAERPGMEAMLAGPPAGFASSGPHDQLADLDDHGAEVGLEAYAWFQFRLAEAAGFMVERMDYADLLAALRTEFPGGLTLRRETVPATLERLERIVPGVGALLADMDGDGAMAAIAVSACGSVPEPGAGERPRTRMIVENRTGGAISLRIAEEIPDLVAYELRLEHFGDMPGETEFAGMVDEAVARALADGSHDHRIEPGMVLDRATSREGAVADLLDGRCFALPPSEGRLILR